jgi:hypothetical protein
MPCEVRSGGAIVAECFMLLPSAADMLLSHPIYRAAAQAIRFTIRTRRAERSGGRPGRRLCIVHLMVQRRGMDAPQRIG